MADKPSRALILYGDGMAPLVASSHSHLHFFASLACCGFLSLRESSSPENENDREIRELAQLLDSYDHYTSLKGENGDIDGKEVLKKELSTKTIPQRFMGLKAAFITSSSSIRSFARDIGFTVMQIDELIKQTSSGDGNQKMLCEDSSLATELLQLLGFSQGKVVESSEFDLVFFHIRANEMVKVFKDKMVIKTDADWLNKFVGDMMQIAHVQSEIASRLLVSLVFSYGRVSEQNRTCSSISLTPVSMNSDLSLLRPRQSYTMKEGFVLNDIRHYNPIIIAQWQNSVTRRDMAKEFSFQEIEKHGGNLAILADRFLHEVAFKLWKAPKYGA